MTSEPDDDGAVADETLAPAARPARPASLHVDEAPLADIAAPLADMPGGTAIGTLVHAVLQHADFAADDLDAELAAGLADQQARRHTDVGDPDVVVRGLRAALDTPLGPLADDAPLRTVPRADRLDELAFEFALAGGDQPTGTVAPADLADRLRAHLPADDPVAGYADRLDHATLPGGLRGYLTGQIDLVVRLDGDHGPRFALFDFKTNRLADDHEPLSAWHYRPAALADAVHAGHYPLQSLLYLVALHRYLRWRLPDYDPHVHLAGAGVLFVRGMTGSPAATVNGQPCGVFTWQPPAALVTDISDLLDHGSATI